MSLLDEDCNMKSLVKPVILASVFSTFGLFCSFSSADEDVKLPKLHQSSGTHTLLADVISPKMTSSSALQINVYRTATSTLPKQDNHKSCNNKKKNEIYELSAIFNDKLQMFLSYFGEAPSFPTMDLTEEDPHSLRNADITSP